MGLGEVLWDLPPEGRKLGGAPFNFAFHCWQRGHAAVMVSRVGTGDTFTAGLPAYWLEGRSLSEAAAFANRLAARVAASVGGTPRIARAEVEGTRQRVGGVGRGRVGAALGWG